MSFMQEATVIAQVLMEAGVIVSTQVRPRLSSVYSCLQPSSYVAA